MNPDAPNAFKAALQDGPSQIGLWQALASPYTAEICAGAGFDWLLFDGEHGPNDVRSLLAQLQAVASYPVHPVARLPMGEAWMVKQFLDIGFRTLLIPFVETASQAEALVAAVRYGPRGIRGMAPGITRAAGWGRIPGYIERADADICLIVQIESVAGLDNLDAILEVEGVDAVFVGPADLSAAFGHRGAPGHPEMVARIEDALRRIVSSGKAAGTLAVDPVVADRAIDLGCAFVAVGTDVGLLAAGSAALAKRGTDAEDAVADGGY